MSTKQEVPAIYLAMACVMRDMQAVAKNQKNQIQGFNFRGIDDVLNALHPIFSDHGIFCLPSVEKLERKEMEKNSKGNANICTHLTVRYRFTSATDGSFVEAVIIGEGTDYGDKSTAKAMSAAYKSCLIQAFLIPTRDIEDGDRDPTIDPHESLRRENDRCMEEEKSRMERLGLDPKLAEPMDTKTTEPAEKQAKEPAKKASKQATTPPPEPAKQESAPSQPETKKPAATKPGKEPEWASYVIACIKQPRFAGRRLDDLTFDELSDIVEIWVEKYAEKRKAENDTARIHEADMITKAFEARKKEQ